MAESYHFMLLQKGPKQVCHLFRIVDTSKHYILHQHTPSTAIKKQEVSTTIQLAGVLSSIQILNFRDLNQVKTENHNQTRMSASATAKKDKKNRCAQTWLP
jgi:hypothetical protein